MRKRNRKINIPVEDIRKLYGSGLSTRQISETTGWSKSYVGRYCKDIARSQRDAAILRQPPTAISWRACRDQARKKVERKIGRKLERWEHVHHIDGDFTNNSFDNLKVLHESEHLSLHNTKPKVKIECRVCGGTRQVTPGYLRKIKGTACSFKCAKELQRREGCR